MIMKSLWFGESRNISASLDHSARWYVDNSILRPVRLRLCIFRRTRHAALWCRPHHPEATCTGSTDT
ncbi:hypothetical protein T02_13371 [Trichinella nativa]|uniref:Uncharacterized protein n=4 Tax=Trichinella TaxID=6333 RepID=A0A0V1KT20_9BILA|nr:hypothetical protein T05_7052 [Trichinella murrelli]KRX71973.1 hypothetical protein T06_10413 [Trichinella sp. T6]KRY28252.1 hypothetical protein T01_7765 [Trichinella spiralis]KRY47504.1 hypothetical protein T03_11286 [Trichinella britovi]KRZ50536.1 hypothetical protein T02_13371 [Trichinella nativa]KRZ86730.1 hypothetical protein T08_1235 [Trichinella sp. T8]